MAWESYQDHFRERTYIFPSSPTSPAPILSKTGSQEHNFPPASLSKLASTLSRTGRGKNIWWLTCPSAKHVLPLSPRSSPSLQLSENLLYSFPTTFSTAFRKVFEKFPKSFRKVSEKFPKSFRKISEKFLETFGKLFGNVSETFRIFFGTFRKLFGNFSETFRKLFGNCSESCRGGCRKAIEKVFGKL